MEDVADLGLPVQGAHVVEHEVADHRAAGGQLDGQVQDVTFGLDAGALQLLLQRLGRPAPISGAPVQVAGHLRPRLHVVDRLEIVAL